MKMKIEKFNVMIQKKENQEIIYRSRWYLYVPHLGGYIEKLWKIGNGLCSWLCSGMCDVLHSRKFEWILEWTSDWSGLIQLGIDFSPNFTLLFSALTFPISHQYFQTRSSNGNPRMRRINWILLKLSRNLAQFCRCRQPFSGIFAEQFIKTFI